jgi:hypothetical protein
MGDVMLHNMSKGQGGEHYGNATGDVESSFHVWKSNTVNGMGHEVRRISCCPRQTPLDTRKE